MLFFKTSDLKHSKEFSCFLSKPQKPINAKKLHGKGLNTMVPVISKTGLSRKLRWSA
jgi:hypothetical protein